LSLWQAEVGTTRVKVNEYRAQRDAVKLEESLNVLEKILREVDSFLKTVYHSPQELKDYGRFVYDVVLGADWESQKDSGFFTPRNFNTAEGLELVHLATAAIGIANGKYAGANRIDEKLPGVLVLKIDVARVNEDGEVIVFGTSPMLRGAVPVDGIEVIKLARDAGGTFFIPVASSSTTVLKDERVGGINFDPTLLNLQIKRDGKGVPLPLPQQDIQNINIKGLYPIIINFQPMTVVPAFLGFNDSNDAKEEKLSRS